MLPHEMRRSLKGGQLNPLIHRVEAVGTCSTFVFHCALPSCPYKSNLLKQTYGHMNRCESWLWRLGATVVFIFLQKVWQQWQDLIGKLRMSGKSLGKTWCWFNWVQPPMIKRLLFWNCSFHTSPFKELLAQAAWICASHFAVYIYIHIWMQHDASLH